MVKLSINSARDRKKTREKDEEKEKEKVGEPSMLHDISDKTC